MFRRKRPKRSSPGTVLSGGVDLTFPDFAFPAPPRKLVDFYGRPVEDLTPGRHERRGRHEAPRVAGVVELHRTMTEDEVLAWKTKWLEARERESRPIVKVSRL